MIERTLVLIKPEAIQRGLVGEIIGRMEKVLLKIEEMKLVTPTQKMVEEHYPDEENWIQSVGRKTIDTYEKYSLNLVRTWGPRMPWKSAG